MININPHFHLHNRCPTLSPSKDLAHSVCQVLKSLDKPIDILSFIIQSKTPPRLNLPPTLLRTSDQKSIFLKTVHNSIKIITNKPEFKFFAETKNPEGFPLYFYYNESNQKICFTEKIGINLWETAPSPHQRMQKFVLSRSRIPSKLRVYWKFSQAPQFFFIENSQTFPKVMIKGKCVSEPGLSKFKHCLSDFPYAGQIFKTSFNHFLPHKSRLTGKKQTVKKQYSICIKSELFKCKMERESMKRVKVENIDARVTNMMESIIKVINDVIGKDDIKVVTELVADFVQDELGDWWFLKIKGQKFDYLPTKAPVFNSKDRRSVLNSNFTRGFYESIGLNDVKSNGMREDRNGLTVENFRKRLQSIDEKIKEIKYVQRRLTGKDKFFKSHTNSELMMSSTFGNTQDVQNPDDLNKEKIIE